jgi:uncharacterized membrane protein
MASSKWSGSIPSSKALYLSPPDRLQIDPKEERPLVDGALSFWCYDKPMLNWLYFIGLCLIAYSLIALFGQLTTGNTQSAWHAGLSTFKPLPFVIIVLANAIWATAIYFGLKNASYALPIALSIGVLTTFVYSILFLHATFSAYKFVGAVFVVAGILLLA